MCGLPPEKVFYTGIHTNRGHSVSGAAIPNAKVGSTNAVFSCLACQGLVDSLFGKGRFDLARFFPNAKGRKRVNPDLQEQKVGGLLKALVEAETKKGFESSKSLLGEYLKEKLR